MSPARWRLPGWWTALLLALALGGCRPGAATPRDVVLGLAELSVDFPDEGQGELSFAVDCPLAPGATVTKVSWELWLDARRFAVGLEGTPDAQPAADGLARVSVRAPLRYRHLRWDPGGAYLQVALAGELTVRRRGVDSVVPFRGGQELITRGAPVLEGPRE